MNSTIGKFDEELIDSTTTPASKITHIHNGTITPGITPLSALQSFSLDNHTIIETSPIEASRNPSNDMSLASGPSMIDNNDNVDNDNDNNIHNIISGGDDDDDEKRDGIDDTTDDETNETTTEEQMDEEERRRREEEEESIALARALMAEEAMAVSYAMSADYLRNNRDEFSEEDLAALQAAMEEDEEQEAAAAVEGDEDGGDGMSYELMLRLGERIGDVKSERWASVAREKIDTLTTTFEYDANKKAKQEGNNNEDNDSEVKCLVCQFTYEHKDCLRKLPCGHVFHVDCVDQWLMSKDFCPYCRQPIEPEQSS